MQWKQKLQKLIKGEKMTILKGKYKLKSSGILGNILTERYLKCEEEIKATNVHGQRGI